MFDSGETCVVCPLLIRIKSCYLVTWNHIRDLSFYTGSHAHVCVDRNWMSPCTAPDQTLFRMARIGLMWASLIPYRPEPQPPGATTFILLLRLQEIDLRWNYCRLGRLISGSPLHHVPTKYRNKPSRPTRVRAIQTFDRVV